VKGLPHHQLYNLAEDRGETVNLVNEKPEITEELTLLMSDYIARGRSTPGVNQENEGDTPFQYQPPAPKK
jgi:hypothetical protein